MGQLNKLWVLCSAVLLTLSMSSCVNDEYNGPDLNAPKRTVLIYLGGDNSLSEALTNEVEELRKGWTYTGNRCLIYVDAYQKAPQLLSLRGGCPSHPTPYIDTLAVYPEENSASPQVFSRVIHDVVSREPAKSYGLVFTSHGSGWLPAGTLANPQRSIGTDIDVEGDSVMDNDVEMELADFASAIPDSLFDFIVFEACLMGGVEVSYALRNKADYLLSSSAELLSPGFVPVMPRSLHWLFETKYTVEQSLTQFAKDYMDYIHTRSGVFQSATLSVIRTSKMDSLAMWLADTAHLAAADSLPDVWALQHFDRPGSYRDYPTSPRYFDFLDWMQYVVRPEYFSKLKQLVDRSVVWKAATAHFMEEYNGFEVRCHSGLTVYREQPCFEKLNESYHQTEWYRATHGLK